MRREVECAAEFLASLLRRGRYDETTTRAFSNRVAELLMARYQTHWHPEKPIQGSAYRCIRNNCRPDPVLSEAAVASGLSVKDVANLLPRELTLWVDPLDVAYRIGDEGSVCSLLG